ncbi:MAG TPA: hypothetical protein VFA20_29270 [Myxococcaceae bacterium]|nr:hypothetical protein [Myxococcaceae bacterium]
MPQSTALRLLVVAVALFIGVSVVWWAVGFQLGKGLLEELKGGAGFRRAYGFEPDNMVALLILCFGSAVGVALHGAAPAGSRLLWLSAAALGTGFVMGGHASSMVGGGMAVFAAAAAAETEGRQRLIASGIGAVIAAFAFALVLGLEGGGWAVAWALRAVFFFFPLVFGTAYLGEQLPKWLKSTAKA